MALAKNPLQAFRSAIVTSAEELADADAMFAEVPAKSNLGTRSRQLREIDRPAPRLVAWGGPAIPAVETAKVQTPNDDYVRKSQPEQRAITLRHRCWHALSL